MCAHCFNHCNFFFYMKQSDPALGIGAQGRNQSSTSLQGGHCLWIKDCSQLLATKLLFRLKNTVKIPNGFN